MTRVITFIIITLLSFLSSLSAQNTNRPQEPIAPFNYISENVFFKNTEADNIKLAGTLTLPKNKKNPAVAILISGSGAQDRNSEIKQFNHKPFLVLSDYLTNNGIAVLRFDERGVAESEGDFKTATSFDFASDIDAAIAYLKTRKDINTSKIGLIGHSEGGLVAPIVASKNTEIAFIVMLAGPGVNGREVLESQSWEMGKNAGATEETLQFNKALTSAAYNVLKTETESSKIKSGVRLAINTLKKKLENKNSPYAIYITDAMITQLSAQIASPWLSTFIITEPKDYLKKTTCPVLALNGSKDLQVLPKLNLENIEKALKAAKNKDVTITELESLNHLFQTAKTGRMQEYSQIEETFSPYALKIISDWINERF
ncbi:alpha/beta hydrolase family protein [Lacinutrix jangbogonensis]|uniref:alpha/beta hydrolase family protein n=1 Tax=Lacinutrix jangbogonensis TaxID=1469557 RepID=UPI00053D7EF0|nr:alpha/beta hydrolase [Lacinutrix jangbogonensis]